VFGVATSLSYLILLACAGLVEDQKERIDVFGVANSLLHSFSLARTGLIEDQGSACFVSPCHFCKTFFAGLCRLEKFKERIHVWGKSLLDQLVGFFVPRHDDLQDNSVWSLLRDCVAAMFDKAFMDLESGLEGKQV